MKRLTKCSSVVQYLLTVTILFLGVARVSAETTCRELTETIDDYYKNKNNPAYDRKGAMYKVGDLLFKAAGEELPDTKKEIDSTMRKYIATRSEKDKLLVGIYKACKRNGPGYLLKEAQRKAVLQAKDSRNKGQ